MATEQQIEANRANAKLGGVKTKEGKAVARWNAVQHGILSREVVIDVKGCKEDRAEYESVLWAVADSLQPDGALEEMLVERVATTYWRMRRLFDAERQEMKPSEVLDMMPFSTNHAPLVSDRVQNLMRYEAHLDRCLFRAIHELQRLQAARRGEAVAAPIAVEVNTSGGE